MHMTAHFFREAIAPVIFAIAEALCPAEVTTIPAELEAPAAMVQVIQNPHSAESAVVSYELYKKRLSDAGTRVDVATYNLMKANANPAATWLVHPHYYR